MPRDVDLGTAKHGIRICKSKTPSDLESILDRFPLTYIHDVLHVAIHVHKPPHKRHFAEMGSPPTVFKMLTVAL